MNCIECETQFRTVLDALGHYKGRKHLQQLSQQERKATTSATQPLVQSSNIPATDETQKNGGKTHEGGLLVRVFLFHMHTGLYFTLFYFGRVFESKWRVEMF